MDRYTDGRRDATRILEGLAAHEAPLLEELKITLDQDFSWDDYHPTTLPNLFKGRPPPRLHHVYLDECLLRFPHAISSPSLTKLTLNNSCLWSTVDEMIEFFKLVPQLESFRFVYPSDHNHGFSTQPSRIHPLRCVSLPNLDDFNVEASLDAGLAMFSYMAFPQEAHLALTPSDCESSSLDRYTEDELGILLARASSAVRAHFAERIEEDVSFKSVTLHISHISAARLHLGIPCGLRGAPQVRAAAASAYTTIPIIADARYLAIDGEMSVFNMRDLACFKHVEHLHVEGIASVLLDSALHDDDPFMDGMFPECTGITIGGFDFVKWPGTRRDGCLVPEGFAQHFADVLHRWCRRAGFEVGVKFRRCFLSPDQVALFREKFGPRCIIRVR
ncbi:unnamed protein product [Peniophora sp. CBMAI 1063]|nr:unnamed protein product [Peniophora sp. CBMAI 1063]